MPDRRALDAIAAVTAAENEAQLQARLEDAVAALGGEHGTFALRIHRPPLDPIEHVMACSPPPPAHGRPPGEALQVGQPPGLPPPWREAMVRTSAWHIMEEAQGYGPGQALRVAVDAGPGARSTLGITCILPPLTGTPADRALRNSMRLLASAMHVAALRLVVPGLLARLAPRLTQRELTCLRWVAQGKSDGVVGTILGVSDSAVHFHMTNVLRKLAVSTRTQAVAKAMALGLVR